MAIVIGIDSSTQSVKVEARDLESGQVVATGSARHPATTPPVSEQEPDAWWLALVEAMSQIGTARSQAVAISVAAQQHGCVVLGGGGKSLRPAKLWNDTTSADQAKRLVDSIGSLAWAQAVGSVPVASFTITKLAWLAENEPRHLDQIEMVMLPHDYLTWRLTGEHVTDRGDASGTGWYSAADGDYRLDLLAKATGLDEGFWRSRLPRVLGPTETAGTLAGPAAVELGLPAGILVGPGSGDNMGAALGLGLTPGDVAMSLGTSGTVYGVSSAATHDETGAVAGFADASGNYLPLVATLNATKVTDTVARWLGTDAPGLAELAMTAESDGAPVLVPYFDGERTPNLPAATGRFVGLTNNTTREQLALAAHDGVLCSLLEGLERLVSLGLAENGRVHLIGGGARSVAYRQRCADLLGRPVVVPEVDETVAAGAAVQAAVIAGTSSFAEVAEAWGLGGGPEVGLTSDGVERRKQFREASAEVI